MKQAILESRVQIPLLPQQHVHRPRLIDLLVEGSTHYKLTHISAPAGYGKTTLLIQWASITDADIVWLSLSNHMNDLERFLRYLLRAWEIVRPQVKESQFGILVNSKSPDIKAVSSAFINSSSDLTHQIVFIFDDFHLIETTSIHKTLIFLLDNLPSNFHFIISERGESPLALARYRAKNEMLEIEMDDLRFQEQEVCDYLVNLMALDLQKNDLLYISKKSEGWITGLRLAALALRRGRSLHGKIISGKQRFISDYLHEDVLVHLDEHAQEFLLRTSILSEFCASLCDAVTGNQDAHEILEEIERENLFLIPLDNKREWFRYHQIFREYLEEYLNREYPNDVTIYHSRAAQWYVEHDLSEQAFHHALKASDRYLMNLIFERYFPAKLQSGELRLLRHWLELIPNDWLENDSTIALAQVGLMLFTGQFDVAIRNLEAIEQQALEHGDKQWQIAQARVTAFRCFIACRQNDLTQAEELAGQALQNLPEDDFNFRHDIYGALGDTYRKSGRWQDAQDAYLKVLNFKSAPVFQVQSVHVYGALADLSLRQGHLRSAYQHWQKALEHIQQPASYGVYSLPVVGWVYIRLGELMYEWNTLDEAETYLTQGLERVELGGDIRALIAGYLIAGRLKLADNEIDVAFSYLEKARPHVVNAKFAHWTSQFERLQLELWLAQDRLRAAVNWSDRMLDDASFTKRPESEIAQLAMARALLVKGDNAAIKRSVSLLETIMQSAEAGRTGIMIEGLALRSIAYWQQGQRADALIHLERALRLAEPEGYVRLFVDLGLPMARLLQDASTRDVMPNYVNALLEAFAGDFELSPQHVLPEPLTPREHDVLQLMAAGLTNSEIADELVIAAGTVKKHAANIYGKLGVSNRTEAARKARELDLLG